MFGMVLGIALLSEGAVACCAGCTGSRTRRTLFDPLSPDVVVAEENAEREFVDSMRRTVRRIP